MNYFLSLLVVILNSSLVFAQAQPNFEKQVDSLFQEYSGKKPGVAVAVVKGGEIVFKKGYGTANLEYNIPVKTNTAFHIASVSKQFTAFTAYLLEAEGKISLEDDVRRYIPELPDYGKTIKIKHLLSHTSGLKDQWALLSLSGWRMDDVITTDQILKLISHQKELNFEPGSQFSYSNTGYTLMALLTERVTDKTFAEFTQDHIFKPLGMVNTQFYDNHEKMIANRAYSYEKYEDTYSKKKLNYATVGATSLFTTVEDLAKWVVNFHSPIIGTPELIKKFNEVSYLDDATPVVWGQTPDRTMYYAKGQMSYLYKGIEVLSHGGHDAGFRAVLTRYPEHQFAVITLSNNEHYTMIHKTFPLAELYLKDFLVERQSITTSPPHKELPAKEKYQNQLNDYKGVYASDALGTEYKIQLKDGRLVMVHKRLDDIVLNEIGKDKFSGVNSFPFEVEFIWQGGQISGCHISNFGAKNIEFIKKRTK